MRFLYPVFRIRINENMLTAELIQLFVHYIHIVSVLASEKNGGRIVSSKALDIVVFFYFVLIQIYMMPQFGANTQECYESRFYSYGLFGLLDEWIKRGFNETPKQMAKIIKEIVSKGYRQ